MTALEAGLQPKTDKAYAYAGKQTIDIPLGTRPTTGVLHDIELAGQFPGHPFRLAAGEWTRFPWIATRDDLQNARDLLSRTKEPTSVGFAFEQLLKTTAKGKPYWTNTLSQGLFSASGTIAMPVVHCLYTETKV